MINYNIQKPETCTEFYKRKNKNNISELTNEELKELNKVLDNYIKYLEEKYIDDPDEEEYINKKNNIKKITITKNKNRSYNYYSEKHTFKNIRIKQLKKIISYTYKTKEPEKCKNYRELKNWCKKQINIIAEFIDEKELLLV